MLKRSIPFLLIFIACAGRPAPSGPELAKRFFFLSAPTDSGLVFIGVADKRSDPKETLLFAMEDAARRVVIFHKVSGEYAVKNNDGSGTFDFDQDTYTALHYDEKGYKQFVDALHFNADTDTVETENALFIRTIYPSTLPFPLKYYPVNGKADQKPGWVNNPPKIDGYETGIGYAGRHASFADTCLVSYNNAIFAIIRNINSVSRSSGLSYENTGELFGYKTTSDNITYSYGTLSGFYALDTWIDPKDKSVWTLAIAKKAK